MKKKNGFTLVELLAVIVILAVILVIAVPKITDTIKNSKIASFESSAKTIAAQAEKKKMEKEILEDTGSINCSDVVKLNDTDYSSCSITFDGNTAKVSLVGSGKFEGLQIINGTKESATAISSDIVFINKIATEYIIELYNDEEKRTANGLEKDTTSDANIRYAGANPNNYVEFNGEAWRIIGVFGSNLKLVRDDILTEYSFDNKTTAQGIDTNYGTNDWTKSYLREFLNDYYYGGKTITCHSETSGLPATNATIICPEINKINATAKSMIQNTMWNLGGSAYNAKPVNKLYESERGADVYSGHETKSSDYIGLIYPSDYVFASTDESCSQDPFDSTCKNNNWLFKDVWYWTISPASSDTYRVFFVDSYGDLTRNYALIRESVRPSVYLKSDIKIVSGSGTKDDMFKLG